MNKRKSIAGTWAGVRLCRWGARVNFHSIKPLHGFRQGSKVI